LWIERLTAVSRDAVEILSMTVLYAAVEFLDTLRKQEFARLPLFLLALLITLDTSLPCVIITANAPKYLGQPYLFPAGQLVPGLALRANRGVPCSSTTTEKTSSS
jgi:hypothetical protein